MKYKLIILSLSLILLLSVGVYADTTFFEDNLGNRDDYIFVNPPQQDSQPVAGGSGDNGNGNGISENATTNVTIKELNQVSDLICEKIVLYEASNGVYGKFNFSSSERRGISQNLSQSKIIIQEDSLNKILDDYYNFCKPTGFNFLFESKLNNVYNLLPIFIIILITLLILILWIVRKRRIREVDDRRNKSMIDGFDLDDDLKDN